MEFIKKLMILFVIVIFLYILLRLIRKRAEIISSQKIEGFTEGLSPIYTDSVVISIDTATKNTDKIIKDMPANYGSQPISNYFIKSSLDSAYNGSSMSIDMVNYVLSRGYRFLDFAVYLEPLTTATNGSPMATVGYSNSISGVRISSNNIRLSDVCTAILQGAFTATSPNPSDPLFLQIRPMYQLPTKSDDSTASALKKGKNTQLNTQIESALELLKRSLAGPIIPTTTLSAVSKKIVLIMDSTVINGKKTTNLLKMISIDPNSKNMKTVSTGIVTATLTTAPPITAPPTITTAPARVKILTQTLPFDNTGNILSDNPNVNTVIVQYKPNFTPMMAWMYKSFSDLLATYENMFFDNGQSAFIELSSIVSNATDATTLNSAIVSPP